MSNPAVAQYEWHADWGCSLQRVFTLQDSAGDPVDVSSFSARMSIRPSYSADPVLTITSSDDISVGTTDGKFTIDVDDEDMEFSGKGETAVWQGVYDIVVTDVSGAEFKLVEGDFYLHPTSSRD